MTTRCWWQLARIACFLAWLSGGALSAPAEIPPSVALGTLANGRATLTCRVGEPVRLAFNAKESAAAGSLDAEISNVLRVGVADVNGKVVWMGGTYSSVQNAGETLRCVGDVRTPAGTTFRFMDTYSPGLVPNSFVFTREVSVLQTGAGDAGFMTRVGLRWTAPVALNDCDGFMPGVWYLDNHFVPPHALAANLADERIWVREDRLPLPLVMLRRRTDGVSLALTHLAPDGTSIPADARPAPLTDARLQTASLGVTTPARPELTLVYPGTEADRTYLGGPRGPAGADRSLRLHPVQPGIRHAYRVLFSADQTASYPAAMRGAWRTAYMLARPTVASVNLSAVYDASLHLLGNVFDRYNGAPGVPFRIHLPGGNFEHNGKDISYQMGFVGQQLPVAYHLLRYGLAAGQSDAVHKGEAILDFWSAHSPTPEGLPRVWYDPYPQGHWRDYHTFLRIASDGMTGALQAWDFARRNGRDRPAWLQFCRRYGDWLLAHQAPDGSWAREYDFSSRVVNDSKLNTTHPIRFLVDLAAATRDRRYAQAAARAGEFCLANIHQTFTYVGGTADNPNVIDKEAGFMALNAFLALHDLTGDARYLAAAAQAADFMETWVYAWNVPPMLGEATRGSLPARLPVSGFSLIATGHSASDLFMAGAAFLYQRLYVATGDPHYLAVARLLLYNPRQFVDANGSLGYGQPGLITEALPLAVPRSGGVNVWLPWLSISVVEPLVRLEETFGTMNLDPVANGVDQLPSLRLRDARSARPRAEGWSPTPVGR